MATKGDDGGKVEESKHITQALVEADDAELRNSTQLHEC
jgi:hypothetical protein